MPDDLRKLAEAATRDALAALDALLSGAERSGQDE